MEIKKLLRDRYSTVLLITGFVLSCFVAVNVLTMMNAVKAEQNKSKENTYKNNASLELENPDGMTAQKVDSIVRELDTDNGNVFIYGYYGFAGTGLYNPCTYLIISQNEEIRQDFVWGRMPNGDEVKNKQKVMAVATNMEPYLYEKNGEKYLTLDSVDYKIVGVYENYDNLDQEGNMDICTYYECIGDSFKSMIANFAVFNVRYGSSRLDDGMYEAEVQRIKTVLESNGINEYICDEEESDDRLASAKQLINQYFMYLTFIFTLINCMVISNIWIKRRHNELVIRRTFGYGMADIARLLLKDLAVYGIISMALGTVLQTVYAALLGKSILSLEFAGRNFIFLAAVLGIIVLASCIIPVLKIRKIVPAADIRQQK